MTLFIATMGTVAEQLSDPHVLAVQNCPWNETVDPLVKQFLHLCNQKLESQNGASVAQEVMSERQHWNGWLPLTREWFCTLACPTWFLLHFPFLIKLKQKVSSHCGDH